MKKTITVVNENLTVQETCKYKKLYTGDGIITIYKPKPSVPIKKIKELIAKYEKNNGFRYVINDLKDLLK